MLFNYILSFFDNKGKYIFQLCKFLLKFFNQPPCHLVVECRANTPKFIAWAERLHFPCLLMQIYTLFTTLQDIIPFFLYFFFMQIFIFAKIIFTP